MHHHLEHAALVLQFVQQSPLQAPNPPPQAVPGLEPISNMILGWLKWAAIVCGVGGLMVCSIMIVVGRRNRNAMASDGISGAVWVVGGLALASLASGLVGAFVF